MLRGKSADITEIRIKEANILSQDMYRSVEIDK
jgi:hypothetical protein